MKKVIIAVPTVALAMMIGMGSASATDAVSDMPLDDGIVVEVTEDTATTTDTTEEATPSEDTSTVDEVVDDGVVEEADEPETAEEEEDAAANDGTTLPLDQGEVDATDVDEGTDTEKVEETKTVEKVVTAPVEEAKVEPLAQTGIDGTTGITLGVLALLGAVGLTLTRKRKSQAV